MPDGKIVFDTTLNNAQLEKDLQREVKKIEKTEADIAIKTSGKNDLAKRSSELGAALDGAKAKLFEMQSASKGIFSPEQIRMQQENVNYIQSQWDTVQKQVERYDRQIADATRKLEQQKQAAAQVTEQIEQATSAESRFDEAAGSAVSRIEKLTERIGKLATRALVFSLISQGFRLMRDWLGEVVTKNDQTAAAIGRLKGALLTLAQPLLSVVIPVFMTLVNLLTTIIGKVAAFLSVLGGKTIKKSTEAAKALNKQADAYGGAGDAAEKAKRQIMGFDEVNKLEDTSAESGGGGGSSGEIAPDFAWSEGITETLDRIADLVLLIAAGLALWKVSQYLPGQLGSILGTLGLLLVTLGGLLIMYDGLKDAWINGVDWGNAAEMVLGLAIAAGALYAAFGSVVAGIALVVGGIALMVTAFRDAMSNGFNLQNTLLAIAGIMATGLGITLLTGSFIPLLIASIASLLLAFTVATGHGDELIAGLKTTCQGFLDFFTGLFTGDMDLAMRGLKDMFSGLGQIGSAVLSGLRDAIWAFLGWLNDKTGGAVNSVIGLINNMISAFCNGWNALANLLSFEIPGIGGISLPRFQSIPQIPYLAQGAVIPPNREFMAVLGDQKHGTNIEAPEDLIRKIVREETAGLGGSDRLAELLEILISVVEGIEVGDETIGRAAARYNRRAARAGGY